MNQCEPIDIYKTPCIITEYTFFWTAHGTFTKRAHTLGYETSLNKYERIQVTQGMLSGHHGN